VAKEVFLPEMKGSKSPKSFCSRGGGDRIAEGMDFADFLVAKKDEILSVAARHGARNVRIFGSVARGEPSAESDLDLLVDMAPDRSVIELHHIACELEQLLGRKVDVATEAILRPRVRQRVLEEAIPLGDSPSMTRAAQEAHRMRRS
jgi:predicted nucleotidyltransferase